CRSSRGQPGSGRRRRAEASDRARPGVSFRAGMKAAVLGAGSWGTTFAQVLCDAGTQRVLYARKPQLAKPVSGLHENPDYLPGITLNSALNTTSVSTDTSKDADRV